MHFVLLVKFKEKPTKQMIAHNLKRIRAEAEEGITYPSIYWTLGRYDAVLICEAPDENGAMKASIRRSDLYDVETLVAIPAAEARELVE